MPKAKKFEARPPLACGGGHIVVYKGGRSSPIPLRLRYTAKPLILLDEECPCPIYIGSVRAFAYLEGTGKLCTGVGGKYQPVRQFLKLALVLQYPIQIDNIAVQVIQHFYGKVTWQMPKDGGGSCERLHINLASGDVLNNPRYKVSFPASPLEGRHRTGWRGDAVQKFPFQLLNGFM